MRLEPLSPIQNFWRPLRREAVTIIAGFRCNEGIVICADTQETVGDISKRNVPKLQFKESHHFLSDQPDMAVAFCGATNNGAFMDEIVERAWKAARLAGTLDEACEAIDVSIKDSYREFGEIYQPGYLPQTELIYGVKMEGDSRLFYALGPAINEKDGYVTGGAGTYMADFLASRMYVNYPNLRQCIILAAYILFQTKEHVVGCGGESHIAALRNSASSGLLDWKHIETLTHLVEQADRDIGGILLGHSDLTITEAEFRKKSQETIDQLAHLRYQECLDLKKWEDFWIHMFGPRDDLGLPVSKGQEEKPEGESTQ